MALQSAMLASAVSASATAVRDVAGPAIEASIAVPRAVIAGFDDCETIQAPRQ
jgi:hypothetical protein